jgi:predicted oxidoreductase (fatty acid repression mutant protein)
MKHIKRPIIGAASVAVAAAAVLLTAMPASASGPHVSMHTWSAYHYADSYGRIQHYNKLTDGSYHFANWATPGNWSNQAVCWSNVDWADYIFQA